ncbi:hypothetical protein AC578_7241 [Pseudocercospora eumusae]|uniref:Uncharacterized protein n=1 Tax=Pseudocercospora eumusae TaxID=321146 RepID=A0A139HWC7_9PEZI|nr:hypothetical protein AC578_7241 [Pseudocercospora eumusae]
MARVRMPSMTEELAEIFSELIAATKIPKTRSILRCNGKKCLPNSKPRSRRPQEDVKEPKKRQSPIFRHEKTAKALNKEAKIASAPRRAQITLTIVSSNPVVVGRFKLTPRGERKLKKLCKAIVRDRNRHLQDFLGAKGTKKRKARKLRAERLAKWNWQNRFDVREEICAGSPGFDEGASERGDEDWSFPDSSDNGDDDGDDGDMSGRLGQADVNFHPDTPFNTDGRTGEKDGLQDTDNLPDPDTEGLLSVSLDWQHLGVHHQGELRVVLPALSF